MTTRRVFLVALSASALAASITSAAQDKHSIPRLGILLYFSIASRRRNWDAFLDTLRERGYVDGRTISIEIVSAEGRQDQLDALAGHLVSGRVDLIATSGTEAVQAAARATKTIPIVITSIGDPVGAGVVSNLARPGGNITGMSLLATDLSAKRLALLKEMLPQVTRVAILWNPGNASVALKFEEMQRAAPVVGVKIQSLPLRHPSEIESLIEAASNARAEAVMDTGDAIQTAYRGKIVELAMQRRLPVASEFSEVVDAGAICSYGPDQIETYRRAAAYVDRILKGAKPGELPIEQPAKLELIVNLKSARALAITIPAALLLRADKVIE